MKVNTDEKERCSVSVHISNESAIIYVTANVSNRGEGRIDVRGVVYCEE